VRRTVLAVCAGLAIAWPLAQGQSVPVQTATSRVLHLPDEPYRYANVELPAHYKTLVVRGLNNTPKDNPITDAGATLGRVLFYDTRLSANNTIACASCHQQKNAFSDARRYSKGFDDKEGSRHAMRLVDVRYYPNGRFFWDERAATLEEQVLMPIQNKLEMGHDLAKLVESLSQDADYVGLFQKAFGDSKVSKERIAQALAQFVRSLVSYQSKYDEGLAKVESVREDFPNFSDEENRGKGLFLLRCAVCHLPAGQTAVFSMLRTRNNGVDADGTVTDRGVANVTGNRRQAGQFKSPSLRNVEYAGPYMHDGRFKTLEEVLDHYSTGVKAHPNLDGALRGRRQMDAEQKAALVAFLKTLSDPKFIADPKFSDPFEAK
jgi:cytochrome c peroxidase